MMNRNIVKLIDFGCACYNRRKSICGTLDYSSPEMLNN